MNLNFQRKSKTANHISCTFVYYSKTPRMAKSGNTCESCLRCQKMKKKCAFTLGHDKCDRCFRHKLNPPCEFRLSEQGCRYDLKNESGDSSDSAEREDSSASVHAPVVRFEILPKGMAAPIQHSRLFTDEEREALSYDEPPFTESSNYCRGTRFFFETIPGSSSLRAQVVRSKRVVRNESSPLLGFVECTQLLPSSFARGASNILIAYQLPDAPDPELWQLGVVGRLSASSRVSCEGADGQIDGRLSVWRSISETVLSDDGFWTPPFVLADSRDECISHLCRETHDFVYSKKNEIKLKYISIFTMDMRGTTFRLILSAQQMGVSSVLRMVQIG